MRPYRQSIDGALLSESPRIRAHPKRDTIARVVAGEWLTIPAIAAATGCSQEYATAQLAILYEQGALERMRQRGATAQKRLLLYRRKITVQPHG